MDRDILINSLYFRHACKVFDRDKKVDKESLELILESARLAPSSFGMEPWRFEVICNKSLKEQLKPHCWNQNQITNCSHLIAIIATTKAPTQIEYIESMFARRGLSTEATKAYVDRYLDYINNLDSVTEWVKRQCYIASSHMMVYASLLGIDTCPIEGFDKDGVNSTLELDTNIEEIALLLPIGYRKNSKNPPKARKRFEDVITFEGC